MSDEYCPRLIEVALPIREISAESVRQKSAQRGHISTLHVWWARRPLAAARAVVFASLVPDPDDDRCPVAFRQAVEHHLVTNVPAELRYFQRGSETLREDDPYRPKEGLADTLRNRLLAFIASWSREALEFEAGRTPDEPNSSNLLDDRCLVKWETADPGNPLGREVLRIACMLVNAAWPHTHPAVLDPFAGGGAIPLEVVRLGAKAIANDYNPVAYILLRATCEFPQIYGKEGRRLVTTEEFGKAVRRELLVENVLIADLRLWANRILERVEKRVGHLYTPSNDGRPILTYIWARTVPCSNPSCRGEIPLLRSLVLRNQRGTVALKLDVDRDQKQIAFGIVCGEDVKETAGTKKQRGPAICPFCDQPTSEGDLRRAGADGKMGELMVAVVVQKGSEKEFRPVTSEDRQIFAQAFEFAANAPEEYIVPEVNGPNASPRAGSHRSINLELYGLTRWGQLFNRRQLVVMNELVNALQAVWEEIDAEIADENYRRALAVYLALWIDRVAVFGNNMCRWHAGDAVIKPPFSGQSIPMMWDYPEVNPFANTSGSMSKQLEYILAVLKLECGSTERLNPPEITLGSATQLSIGDCSVDCVVTDPPYGDSIAYADLSDFFYVWLKRSLGHILPAVFATPQTPKDLEATSHKHRHEGSRQRANSNYQRLLTGSFAEATRVSRQPKLVCVMFAHQSTDAWKALMAALFDAGLCPTATWPLATEKPTAALGLGGANLESSVTVVCRLRSAVGSESFKVVKKEIQQAVEQAVHRFWNYGFRGADLIVASYGPAVGVFGQYERVERADGTPVEVPELLDFARQAARDAIAGEFRGDNLSTLYYVWSNLYGAAEQSWDDARLVVQIGGDVESAMDVARRHEIFVINGSKCRLALLADRADRRGLGVDPNPPLIDALHRAMLLWKSERRSELVGYLADRGLLDEARFWKLAQALFEVLPRSSEDWKLVSAVLGERDTLRTEAKRTTVVVKPQTELDFGTTEAGGE